MIYFLIFIAIVVWVIFQIKKEKVAGDAKHDAIMANLALRDKKRIFSCPKCDKSTYIRDVACSNCSKPLKYESLEQDPSRERILLITCKACNLISKVSCPHCNCTITYSRIKGLFMND